MSTRGGCEFCRISHRITYDIGDTVVVTCLHQPYHGKPVHVSRIWIKRDGKWVMSISYQTTIQAAPPKS